MTEATNELIYEVLKAVQPRLGNIEQGQKETNARLSAMQTHLMAIEKDVANVYDSLGALENRMSKVERRLDLRDEPAE